MTRPLVVTVISLPGLPRVRILLKRSGPLDPLPFAVISNDGHTFKAAHFETYPEARRHHQQLVKDWLDA